MKSDDRHPQTVGHDETSDPDTESQGGGVGKVPIAVSEGDFSTPSIRKRTITRPRGLRTLEQSAPMVVTPSPPPVEPSPPSVIVALTPSVVIVETPAVVSGVAGSDGAGMGNASDLGASPTATNDASAVDEFLAAPPTPQPEIALTPVPDLVAPLGDLDGSPLPVPEVHIENLAAATQMREAARAGDGQPRATPLPPEPAPLPAPDAARESDLLVVDLLGDGASDPPSETLESLLVDEAAPAPAVLTEVSPAVVAEYGEFSSGPIFAVSEATPMRESPGGATNTETPPSPEGTSASSTSPPVPADANEPELSPLAQTLAHMAEAMQSDLTGESGVDIDIADAPLVQLPAEALTPAAPSRSIPPPPPGSQPGADDRRVALPVALVGLPEALVERPRRPKRSKPWFEEVFDESYLRTLPFMTANQTLREVDFIESSLAIPKGGEVLDIGCGYGRHAIELVQRGLAVTGLDLSLPLLIRAADESQRRSVSVNFMHADMREMSFDRQFAGAYCMLTSFGYFDEESNLKVAEGIARALKPGGRFLIDVVNRDYLVGDLPARVWWEGDGCVVLEEVDFNFNTNRVLTHRSVVFEDGQQLEQEISVRVYSLHELGKLLRQAGFRVLEVSGSIPTRGHFLGANSRNLLILAERRSD